MRLHFLPHPQHRKAAPAMTITSRVAAILGTRITRITRVKRISAQHRGRLSLTRRPQRG